MKKQMLFALCAISFVVAGFLVVACTPESNTPEAPATNLVQYAAVSEQASEDAWADFNAQVEALNEKYASMANSSMSRSHDLETLIPYPGQIAGRDIIGALVGVELSRTITVNGEVRIIDHVTVIMSALYSYVALKSIDENSQSSIALRNISSIGNLSHSFAGVLIGKRHNQLLSSLLSSGFDSSDMTYRQLVQAFINKYEELYAQVPSSSKSILLNSSTDRPATMASQVEASTAQYQATTNNMSLVTKRNYTDEYLTVVGTAQLDAYDKFQMSMYAVMSYYSGALWIVQ